MKKGEENGIEICPKCKGQGWKRYRFWDSLAIIDNLIRLKANDPIDDLGWSMELIKIQCPLCDGDGTFDWVRAATKADISKTFEKHEGCMDLYMLKAVSTWPAGCKTHEWPTIRDLALYKYPEKLIECAQKRYANIKLDERILSFSLSQLLDLKNKIEAYKDLLNHKTGKNISESDIYQFIDQVDLNEFSPDKIVHPGPDDLPSV